MSQKYLANKQTYIIAELSANHNQQLETALELVRQAKICGADAIKLQTYTADTITINCDNEHFQINCGTQWDGQTLYQLYQKAYTPWEWHGQIMDLAHSLGMDCFSSPFDESAVDFLDQLGVDVYKIASFEAMDHILLKKIASKGKPVIMSSGITDLTQLAESFNILLENGLTSDQICLLKCTSAYPAPVEDANLKTINHMQMTFGCRVGLSDHTLGIEVPIAAVCLGATVIEKHFTLSRESGSPDDAFSLEPKEFKQMVDSIRVVEKAIGKIKYEKSDREKKNRRFARSLFVVKDIKQGEQFTSHNIRSIRPGNGLHTRYYEDLIKTGIAHSDLTYGTPLDLSMIKWGGNMSNKFRNVILIIVFNYANCLNNKQYFQSLYSQHFKKIIFYSDISNEVQMEDVNYINIVRGAYTHRVFGHFFENYRELIAESDGVFYTMDDNILNPRFLNNFSVEKPITGLKTGYYLPWYQQSGWQWDCPWGKRAIQEMVKDEIYKNRYNDLNYYSGRFADFFYLPRVLFNEKFITLLKLFAKYEVFLELAIPTAFDYITQNVECDKFEQTVLWSDEDRAKLNNKDFFNISFEKSFIVHPIKLNMNPLFRDWLNEIFHI